MSYMLILQTTQVKELFMQRLTSSVQVEKSTFFLMRHIWQRQREIVFSGSGKRTPNLWNNGKYLLWGHIAKLYFSDLDCGLHQLPKLTVDHIDLKSFSKMKVSLAVQVMSKTVSLALKRH